MKISFLVTYYNQEKYVADSLRNIYELEFPHGCDYEVLVGDDGSTDHTLDEVKKWGELFGGRLHIFQMERDAEGDNDPVVRASRLRRFLLKKSAGDYFCVLDGDDYYCSRTFVGEALRVYEANPDVAVVMFNYCMVYSGGAQETAPSMKEGIVDSRRYIREYYKPAGSCLLKRPRTSDFFVPLEDALYYDDSDIVIYHLCFGKLYYIDQVIYSYRQRESSIWHDMNRAQQGALNMLGADNEAFLAPIYRDEIYYRYRRDIFYAWFRRFCPDQYMGRSFYERYLGLCRNEYISKTLLVFQESTVEEKRKLEEIILHLRGEDPEEFSRIGKAESAPSAVLREDFLKDM